jgi:diguanylate cyclase (GGDEF)-like protein
MTHTLRKAILVLFLCPAPCVAVTPPEASALDAQVQALEKSDLDDAGFASLVARLGDARAPALLARAYMWRCNHGLSGDHEATRLVAETGIAIARDARAAAELSGLLVCRGYIDETAGRHDSALADYSAAAQAALDGKDRSAYAQARVLRGEVQHVRGEYAAALQDMQEAYRIYVELRNDAQQRYVLNGIANLYSDARVGQYAQALDYYRQLLRANEAAGNEAGIATAHFNIASTLERIDDLPGSVAGFEDALARYRALGDETSVAQTQRAMAVVLVKLGRAGEALPRLQQALAYGRSQDDAELQARVRVTLGSALRALERDADALRELDQARAHYLRSKNARFLEFIEKERALALSSLGNWRDAYAALLAHVEHGRRLYEQLDEELTSRLRVQFDSQRKEQENLALQRENDLRRDALAAQVRIGDLQRQVIALAGLLIALLGAWGSRTYLRARQMRRLALTDELTGLPNRRSVLESASRALQQARERGHSAAVALLDIDHFKSINDRLGHDVGDVVLREVAKVASANAGPGNVAGRLGGEEFLIVIGNADESARARAEIIRCAIESLRLESVAPGMRVTASLGVAKLENDVAVAVKQADDALYRAKREGRNRVVCA